MEPSTKEKQDFECNQVKEGSPLLGMRFGEGLSVLGATWLLALSVLKAMELKEQLLVPLHFFVCLFVSCLLTRKEGQIFEAFWGFWSLAQRPRPKSESTASDLPSFPFFPMASLHSKDCAFLHCSWGRNQACDLSGPCAPLSSDLDCDSTERRKFRRRAWSGKASWVWWFHSQATSLNQNLTFTTISYWFWNLTLIWWQLLGGGYGLGEILLNCRQFYCTHQK